jgi:hypothetical protein
MRRLGIVLSLSLIFTACSTSPPQQNPQAKNQIIECSEASSFIGEEIIHRRRNHLSSITNTF